jgi:hypothetical protein
MAQFIGIGLSKFETPLPHRFIGHDDPALCEEFLNIAKTERKAEIEPGCMTDNFWRETEAFVIGSSDVRFHELILTHGSTTLPS